MKAVMVMFDTLNRHMLPPYGCDWVHAPNFQRLNDRTISFENSYVASMPCMPARRELHTGRYNFLHRSWGPLEPFDDSMPEILRDRGIYTHLTTDHQHYFEDGGATYHQRYNTWEFSRGQEGDGWLGQVADPVIPPALGGRGNAPDPSFMRTWRQDWINRSVMTEESAQPQAKTFASGLDFMRRNHAESNWFLQLETFDPHEPFFTQEHYKALYPHDYDGDHFDWPPYRPVDETDEQVRHVRYEYAALLSMCDVYLGKVLDLMDELEMWDDTMLIVCTDHGFLLGEHDWWAKIVQPFYNEVAHTPLFIWDPRIGRKRQRVNGLVQMIDLPATLLDFFDVPRPADMQGIPLGDTINGHNRPGVLFGVHGGHVNITDGRYVYMRAPVDAANSPLYEYTLMPTHMRQRFAPQELQEMELAAPFSFTKGCRTLKIPGRSGRDSHRFGTMLFDLHHDPQQMHPITDPIVEERMIHLMVELMQRNDAPKEQFERLGLERDV